MTNNIRISKNDVARGFAHFFIFTFVVAAIVVAGIVAENNAPPMYSYSSGFDSGNPYMPPEFNKTNYNILFDQHSHTTASDGDLTVEENLLWHISQGYNACVLTDHGTFENSYIMRDLARNSYNDTIKILIGEEWSTDRIHMNFILPPNITPSELETIPDPIDNPTDQDIQDMINLIHGLNGLVIVDHFPWSILAAHMDTHPTRQQVINWGADFIEIVNGWDFDLPSYQLCEEQNVGLITGTDMHSPYGVYGWTTINVSTYTEQAIFNELQARRTNIIYNQTGALYSSDTILNPNYLWLQPLISIGRAMKVYDLGNDEYDWTGITIALTFAYGFFIVAEVFRILNNKFWAKVNNKRNKL
jgi:hypothetical protein